MMNPNLNGLSVQQARLEAVLMKMRDLVPFVEDRDCDQVLKVLRDVVNAAIRRKDDPKKATFKDMPITDLLGLNDKKETPKNPVAPKAHIRRLNGPNSTGVSVKKSEEQGSKRGRPPSKKRSSLASAEDNDLSSQKDFGVKGPPRKEHRRMASSSLEEEEEIVEEEEEEKVVASRWDPEEFPRVQKVASVTNVPDFRMELLTKRSGAGNHSLVRCFVDKEGILLFDGMEHTKHISVAREFLVEALQAYSRKHHLDESAVSSLRETEFGKKAFPSLVENGSNEH